MGGEVEKGGWSCDLSPIIITVCYAVLSGKTITSIFSAVLCIELMYLRDQLLLVEEISCHVELLCQLTQLYGLTTLALATSTSTSCLLEGANTFNTKPFLVSSHRQISN